jgi:CubicO group peptidase (beta-lactamase class C family)
MTDRRRQLRLMLVTAVAAAVSVAAACTAAPTPAPTPIPTPAATTTIEVRPPSGVDYRALETELKRRLAAGPETVKELRSILISVDGTTELAFYQGSKATDHQHVWSVTKSVLSILVGIAVDEGKLRLDQPLAELLPEHASVMTDDQKATTLRQLLTMTGGMAGDGGGLNPEAEDPIGLLLTYSSTGPRDVFAYSDSGAHLVAAVLHVAVDRSLLDYAREKLFDPLGIDSQPAWEGRNLKDGFDDAGFAWQTDSRGTHIGAYGLKLTPPDLVKLGELYLDEGVWHGRRIVSAEWVRASTAPQLTEEQAASDGQYGYLWRVEVDPEMPTYTAVGGWCQLVLVIPSRRVVLVRTVDDSAGYDSDRVCDDLAPIVEEVVFGPLIV